MKKRFPCFNANSVLGWHKYTQTESCVTTAALMNIHLVAAKCLHLIMEISITEQTAEDSLIPVRVKLQCLAYECQLSQINSADTCGSAFKRNAPNLVGRLIYSLPLAPLPDPCVPPILFLRQSAIIVFKLQSYCTLCTLTWITISKCCVNLKREACG